jgi:hypothetical protein
VLRARNLVLADQERLARNWRRLDERRQAAIAHWETEKAAARLSGMRRGAPSADLIRAPFDDPRQFKDFIRRFRRGSSKEQYYKDWAKARRALDTTPWPDIDTVSPPVLRPGSCIEIWGTCFGASPGDVLFSITIAGAIVELRVVTWTDTYICACLDSTVTGLASYSGWVLVQDASQTPSNIRAVAFLPVLVRYAGTFDDHLGGGLFGDSKDAVALDGEVLSGGGDFWIQRAELHHWGDGWAELRAPHASGNSFAQGFHIGVDAFDTAFVTITYRLIGPRDVPLPSVPIAFGLLGPIA